MGTFTEAELSRKDIAGHRVGLEPTSPHYGCGVLAAERPVQSSVRLGPEGLEPSHTWVRARRSATRALVPNRMESRIARRQRPHTPSNNKARCFFTPGLEIHREGYRTGPASTALRIKRIRRILGRSLRIQTLL